MILRDLAGSGQTLEQCRAEGLDGLPYRRLRLSSGRPIRESPSLVLAVSRHNRLPNLFAGLGEQSSLNRNMAIGSLSHEKEPLLPLDIYDR